MYNKVLEGIALVISLASIIWVLIYSHTVVLATNPSTATAVNVTVAAVAQTCDGSVVAVELQDEDGNIDIYEFYGDDFTVGEEVTVIINNGCIIDVVE